MVTDKRRLPPDLSDQERDVIARAQWIANEVLSKNAERYDREAVFPVDNFEALRCAGLVGVTVPRQYGGLGMSLLGYILFLKALARGCPSTASSFHMHNVVMWFIDLIGTEEQKHLYFSEVVERGRLFGSWGAEPTTSFAGTVALSTEFREVAGGYEISGSKYFCSLAEGASYGLLFAVPEGRGHEANLREVQFFIVDAKSDGIEIESYWDPLGMRATVSKRIILRNCRVPAIARLGEPGAILRMPTERFALGYAAVYQGIAEAAFDFATRYANERTLKPSNVPIAHFERIQRKVGQMDVAICAGASVLEDAARTMVSTEDEGSRLQCAQRAKVVTTRVALTVTSLAMEVCGGSGAMRGNPVERYFRDARTATLMVPGYDQCIETLGKIALGMRVGEFS